MWPRAGASGRIGAVDPSSRSSRWCIDRGLAGDLAAMIRWDPGDGTPALVSALARWMPAGSTAKLDAIWAGQDPPGADAAAVARQMVDAASTGASQPTWSCWARATVMAALVETLDAGTAAVAATRRLGAPDGVVDFHSAVLARGDDGSWLTDPHFVAAVPGPGEAEVEHRHRDVWAWRVDRPDGRWSYWLQGPRWTQRWHYLAVAPVLDADDVLAFCRVSVSFTGVPPLRSARVAGSDWAVTARIDEAGVATCTEWRGIGSAPSVTAHEVRSWAEACAAFAASTGVPVH